MTERHQLISKKIVEHTAALGCALTVVSGHDWNGAAPNDVTNLFRPFGWVPAMPENGFTLWVSYDVIEAQTNHLDDEYVGHYLDAILYMADLHVIHHDKTPDERARLTEDVMYELGPSSLELVTDVQLAAIDSV